jgi:hypothetical protein
MPVRRISAAVDNHGCTYSPPPFLRPLVFFLFSRSSSYVNHSPHRSKYPFSSLAVHQIDLLLLLLAEVVRRPLADGMFSPASRELVWCQRKSMVGS